MGGVYDMIIAEVLVDPSNVGCDVWVNGTVVVGSFVEHFGEQIHIEF